MDDTRENQVSLASDDEISLGDLYRTLVTHKGWMLGCPIFFVAAALIFVLTARPEWEATAVIQVGRVASEMIETAPRAMERLRMRSFGDGVLAGLKIPLDDNDLATLYRRSMTVKIPSNTDLIELRIHGYSREEAGQWAQASVARLKDVHDRLAQATILRLTAELSEAKESLKTGEQTRNKLLENLSHQKRTDPGNRFAEGILMSNILANSNSELRDIQHRKLVLDEQLSGAKTFSTSLIEQVSVTDKPVFPKKLWTVAAAGVAGLLLGIAGAFVAARWHRA